MLLQESKNIRNLKILRLKKVMDHGMVEIITHSPMETISKPEVLPLKSKKRSTERPDILSIAIQSARVDEELQPSDTVVNTVPNRATTFCPESDNNKKEPNVSSNNEDPKKQICSEVQQSFIELDKLFVCKECGKYSVKLFLTVNKYKFTQLKCLSCR